MAVDGTLVSLIACEAGEDFVQDDLYTEVAIDTSVAAPGVTPGKGYPIVKQANANAGAVVGVLYSYGPAGTSVQVACKGVVRFKAPGALATGAQTANMDGTTGAPNSLVLKGVANAGEIAEVLLR